LLDLLWAHLAGGTGLNLGLSLVVAALKTLLEGFDFTGSLHLGAAMAAARQSKVSDEVSANVSVFADSSTLHGRQEDTKSTAVGCTEDEALRVNRVKGTGLLALMACLEFVSNVSIHHAWAAP